MFMYRSEIFNGIVKLLMKEKSLNYTSLYEKVREDLGRKLSHRDYNAHLRHMVEERILHKEIEGKRSSKYYHLTESARKQCRLEILGIGNEYEKRQSLYHLLINFENFKRGEILNDKQLHRLLKKIGTSKNKLKRNDISQFKNMLVNVEAAYEESISEIQILQLSTDKLGRWQKEPMYYVLYLGFSIIEFISYIRKLRNNREPRPFSRYAPLVPFVGFIDYSRKEIEDAVNNLQDLGLLRTISFEVQEGKRRFRIINQALINLTQYIHFIEMINFYQIAIKIFFINKPNNDETNNLVYYFGEKNTDKLIAMAYNVRRKNLRTLSEQELQEKKDIVLALSNAIERLLLLCAAHHKEILKDELLRLLYLPFSVYDEHN